VYSASLQDGSAGKLVLQKLFNLIKHSVHNRYCRLKLLWADAAYAGIREYVRQHFGWKVDIVRRLEGLKGFKVLPHRWITERTFG
jgi:putative transposase